MRIEPERAVSVKKNSSVNCFSASRCEAGTERKEFGRRAVQVAEQAASSPNSLSFDFACWERLLHKGACFIK